MPYEYSSFIGSFTFNGLFDTGTTTGLALDSAFTYESSGDAVFLRFISPVSQTSGDLTVHAWVISVTGSPTDVRAAVYNGAGAADDPDRPQAGGSALATSGATDLSGEAGSWATFTITGLSLTAGATYYILFDNRTATPASNYPVIAYMGTLAIVGGGTYRYANCFRGGYTINGFTADPGGVSTGMGVGVIKFNDGTLLGQPYSGTGSTHANNTNDRGIRIQFTEDIIVSGVMFGWTSAAISGIKINKTDGTNIVTQAADNYQKSRAQSVRFSPVTLLGGVNYDIVITYSANSTTGPIITMGEASPPTDVQNCRLPSLAYVDGSTPGSYDVDNLSLLPVGLIIDSNPAITGAVDYAFI